MMENSPKFYFPKKDHLSDIQNKNDSKIFSYITQHQFKKAYEHLKILLSHKNITLDDTNENTFFRTQNSYKESLCQTRIKSQSCNYFLEFYSYAVLLYNLGIVSWKLGEKTESVSALSKCLEFYHNAINECYKPEKKIVYKTQMVRISLHFCIVLSQMRDHESSSKLCKRMIQILEQVLSEMHELSERLEGEVSKKQGTKNRRVNFRKVVVSEAKQKIIPLRDICSNVQKENSNQKIKEIIDSLYCWENTFENNEKFMKLTLGTPLQPNTEACRNILGINKIPDWIQSFNIGYLLTMEPKTIGNNHSFDGFYLISTSKILELAVLSSVSLFTFSTEIRFMKNLNCFKGSNPTQKYLQMNNDSQIIECKIMHLKAIEIAMKYLFSSQKYLSHLIISFNKNYKIYMETIDQEKSMSNLMSLLDHQTKVLIQEKSENHPCSTASQKSEQPYTKADNISKQQKLGKSPPIKNKSKYKQKKRSRKNSINKPKKINTRQPLPSNPTP